MEPNRIEQTTASRTPAPSGLARVGGGWTRTDTYAIMAGAVGALGVLMAAPALTLTVGAGALLAGLTAAMGVLSRGRPTGGDQ